MTISYDGRRFRAVSNTPNGDTSDETIFDYHQTGVVVWATYTGGTVKFGTLVASVLADGSLDMRYQHLDTTGTFKTGTCRSRLEVLPDGRYRLHEEWQWSSPETSSGRSVVEEIAE
jgi:hypothetical protein